MQLINIKKNIVVLYLMVFTFFNLETVKAGKETVLPNYFTGKVIVQDRDIKKQGSGIVFIHKGLLFVVSSDHVSLASTSSHHFFIKNQMLKMNLIYADWISGLSLFKINKTTKQIQKLLHVKNNQWLTLNHFDSNKKNNDLIKVAGFPSASKQRSVLSTNSKVVINAKDQFFLSERPMLDIVVPVKLGMSGGGAFYQTANVWKVLGLNSHIYKKNDLTHLLLISALDVKVWVKNILKGNWMRHEIIESTESRNVVINGLRFRKKVDKALKVVSVELRSGTDPIGIGGQFAEAKNKASISVSLDLVNYFKILDNRLSEKTRQWFYSFQEKQLSGYHVKISYFLNDGKVYFLTSLPQFFKYLGLGYQPVAQIESKFDGLFFLKKQVKRKEVSEAIKKLSLKLQTTVKPINSATKTQFFSYLQSIVQKINSEVWFLVDVKDLKRFMQSMTWHDLYNNEKSFDLAVELNAQIGMYISIMPYLVIP